MKNFVWIGSLITIAMATALIGCGDDKSVGSPAKKKKKDTTENDRRLCSSKEVWTSQYGCLKQKDCHDGQGYEPKSKRCVWGVDPDYEDYGYFGGSGYIWWGALRIVKQSKYREFMAEYSLSGYNSPLCVNDSDTDWDDVVFGGTWMAYDCDDWDRQADIWVQTAGTKLATDGAVSIFPKSNNGNYYYGNNLMFNEILGVFKLRNSDKEASLQGNGYYNTPSYNARVEVRIVKGVKKKKLKDEIEVEVYYRGTKFGEGVLQR